MRAEYTYSPPANAEEFYRRDGDYIKGLVRKLLLGCGNSQDAEDVAADIMEKLVTVVNRNGQTAIDQYNPQHVSEHTHSRVTWRAFLSAKVSLYVRGKRDQVTRRNNREILLLDSFAADGLTWAEVLGGSVWDDYPFLSDDQFVCRMRDYLATVPDMWEGSCSLFAMFNGLIEHLKSGEPLSCREVQDRFDVTPAKAAKQITLLREAVRGAAEVSSFAVFEVGGLNLSVSEVRTAADLLRTAKGNRVHPALEGHRLYSSGKKWYLGFAAAEQKMYPEVLTDPRTHRNPADHVKRAVIHRLERMLAEARIPAIQVHGPE